MSGLKFAANRGQILKWNQKTFIPNVPGKCGLVHGAGDFFRPNRGDLLLFQF